MPEVSPALARGQKGGPKINKSSESDNQILVLKRAVQARALPLNYSRSEEKSATYKSNTAFVQSLCGFHTVS